MTIKNAFFLTAMGLIVAGLSGCTAPLAMQGLGSASPVGFSYIGRGKGDSFWLARFDDVVQATGRAGRALSLKLKEEKIKKDQAVFYYMDDKGNQLNILIERRTETMTYALFDAGLFGSRSMGRLMAGQIVYEMRTADAFLRKWHPLEAD